MWQPGAEGQLSAGGFLASPMGQLAAITLLIIAMLIAAYLGFSRWGPVR
jgi:hypothetical protein